MADTEYCDEAPRIPVANTEKRRKAKKMAQTLSKVEAQYLTRCMHDKAGVTIHLLNGTKLTGRVTDVGDDALVLERDGEDQLVWYHAMSTVARK